MFQTLADYLNENQYLYETDGNFNCIKMIIAQITVKTTSFTNQQYIVSATGSRLSFESSSFSDLQIQSKLFRVSESDLALTNITITNKTCSTPDDEIFYLVKAYVQIDGLSYLSSRCRLVNSGLSQIQIKVRKA